MATEIKSIPVLKEKVAKKFNSKAEKSYKKKQTINFSEQLAISSKILEKAKL